MAPTAEELEKEKTRARVKELMATRLAGNLDEKHRQETLELLALAFDKRTSQPVDDNVLQEAMLAALKKAGPEKGTADITNRNAIVTANMGVEIGNLKNLRTTLSAQVDGFLDKLETSPIAGRPAIDPSAAPARLANKLKIMKALQSQELATALSQPDDPAKNDADNKQAKKDAVKLVLMKALQKASDKAPSDAETTAIAMADAIVEEDIKVRDQMRILVNTPPPVPPAAPGFDFDKIAGLDEKLKTIDKERDDAIDRFVKAKITDATIAQMATPPGGLTDIEAAGEKAKVLDEVRAAVKASMLRGDNKNNIETVIRDALTDRADPTKNFVIIPPAGGPPPVDQVVKLSEVAEAAEKTADDARTKSINDLDTERKKKKQEVIDAASANAWAEVLRPDIGHEAGGPKKISDYVNSIMADTFRLPGTELTPPQLRDLATANASLGAFVDANDMTKKENQDFVAEAITGSKLPTGGPAVTTAQGNLMNRKFGPEVPGVGKMDGWKAAGGAVGLGLGAAMTKEDDSGVVKFLKGAAGLAAGVATVAAVEHFTGADEDPTTGRAPTTPAGTPTTPGGGRTTV